MFWVGFIIGMFLAPILVVAWAGGIYLHTWFQTQRLMLRKRDEWNYENPYWQEAFDAGIKWVDDGKPQGQPFLGRLSFGDTKRASGKSN